MNNAKFILVIAFVLQKFCSLELYAGSPNHANPHTVNKITAVQSDPVLTDDSTVWHAINNSVGGCCPNFVMTPSPVSYTVSSSFVIGQITAINHDISSNNHDGHGNVRAYLYDQSDNLIATSLNTVYGEGYYAMPVVWNFDPAIIPQTFELSLIGDDILQGFANFSFDSVQMYASSLSPSMIGGSIFYDLDGNGIWDPGEYPLSGRLIRLTRDGNEIDSMITDPNGFYRFSGLHAGSYILSEKPESNWVQTFPPGGAWTVVIDTNIIETGKNFGNNLAPPAYAEVRQISFGTFWNGYQQWCYPYDGIPYGSFTVTSAFSLDSIRIESHGATGGLTHCILLYQDSISNFLSSSDSVADYGAAVGPTIYPFASPPVLTPGHIYYFTIGEIVPPGANWYTGTSYYCGNSVFWIFHVSLIVPSIHVFSPNGSETWIAGTIHSITWTSTGVANVKIEYSTDNGTTWTAITASTPASAGTYAWAVPNTPTSQALVRIRDASNSAVNDVSDAVFSIGSSPSLDVEIASFTDLPPQQINLLKATEKLSLKIRLTNRSGYQVSDVKLKGMDDVAGMTFELGNYDVDQDGDIDLLDDQASVEIAGVMLLPDHVWEDKNITVQVYEVNGISTNCATTKNISVYSLVGEAGRFFKVDRDAYSFQNDWVGWYFELESYLKLVYPQSFVGTQSFIDDFISNFGLCAGMSASSLAYFEDPLLKPSQYSNNETYNVPKNLIVAGKIFEYHLMYFVLNYAYLGVNLSGTWPTPNQAETRMISYFKDQIPFCIQLKDPSLVTGHTIAPIKLVKVNSDDSTALLVYDNLIPNEARILSFNSATNSFKYSSSGHTFDHVEALRCPLVPSSAGDLPRYLFYYLNAKINDLWIRGKQLISYKCPVHLLITDGQGRRCGFVNGEDFMNEIPGAIIYSFKADSSGLDSLFLFEVPNNLNYKVRYFGYGNGDMTSELLKPLASNSAITIRYDSVPLTPTTVITGSIDSTENFALSLDRDGNGVVDTMINPSVANSPPIPFDLDSPTSDSALNAFDIRLVWHSSVDLNGDSIYYRAIVSEDSIFSFPDSSEELRDTAWAISSTLVQDRMYYWKVKARDIHGATSWSIQPFWKFKTPPGSTFQVKRGWNLVSTPLLASNHSKVQMFPNAISNAFYYNGQYIREDTLTHGLGYWLKFNEDQLVSIAGQPMVADTILVNGGWNLVGSVSLELPSNSITSIPPGVTTSKFFDYDGIYRTVDTIKPGRGYWVKVSQIGDLILSPSFNAALKNRIRIMPTAEIPPAPPVSEETQSKGLPGEFTLDQNYPNPFNPFTVIHYQLPVISRVTLRIYNVLGEEIKTLIDQTQNAGYWSAEWNADGVASGLYLCRLDAVSSDDPNKSISLVRKMVLLH